MKKIYLVFLISILLMSVASLAQNANDSSDISVNVDRKCQAAVYGFSFITGIEDDQGYPLIGTGGNGYFTYLPYNNGEMAYIHENISIYRYNTSTNSRQEIMDLSPQNVSYSEKYLFNSTNFNADSDISRLLNDQDNVLRAPYWFDTSFDNWENERPESLIKQKEFIATTNFTNGIYEAEIELEHTCEFQPDSASIISEYDSQENKVDSFNFSEYNPGEYNSSEVLKRLFADGINVSTLEKNDDYARSVEDAQKEQDQFRVVTVEGNGSTPDEVSDTNQDIGRNLETDADEVSNLTKNSSLNKDVNESVNSSRETSANTTTDFETNASLESDAEQTSDSTPVEGNNQQPGQTPEPQPQPQPEPTPLLSVDLRPLNTSYTGPRGEFTEVSMEIENKGEESISNLELSPRFSEGMDWESQSVSIGSLPVGESVNESVFVQPGESVEPGIYQIPVYASNAEDDIASQYVNVEVTEEISRSALSIAEAPQDIRFEVNSSYSVPVLLENSGDDALTNVQIELQNTENCGEYTAEEIEEVAAGDTASISVDFQTSDALQECEATIVASSDSGSFAFSEMNVETVEDKGVVPQKFRVPIIASLWTVMLVVYTVVFRRYGVDRITIKIPLIILIAGEVFILIYLSSAYYNVLPPGLLPFSSA